MKRGRPRLNQKVEVIQVKIRLYDSDGDLAAFFRSIPPRLRAVMVKRALRSGMGETPVTEQEDMLDALDSLVE